MAIPDSFIDDLKSRVDIAEFIAASGVELKRAGKSSKALCPMPGHDEKTPSFNVIHDKQFCYCHGCGGGGDVFQFAMATQGITFPEAIEVVAAHAGIEVPSSSSAEKNDWGDVLRKALDNAQSIYRSNLSQGENPEMIQQLKKRQLTPETAAMFGLGIAKDDWAQIKNMLGGHKRLQILTQSGLCFFQEASGENREKFYDRFRDGITIPIKDKSGNLVSFAIRHAEGKSPKYINGIETQIFKKNQILFGLDQVLAESSRPKSIVVVEGYFDVMKMHQHNLRNATAPMGTAITDRQIEQLLRVTNEVTFCFDGDAAGLKAAKSAMFTLLPYIDDHHTFKFCFLPEGHDPDSLLNKEGPESLQRYLDNATPFSQFIFQTMLEGRDLSIQEQVAGMANEFAGLLNQMPESHLKAGIANRFEKHTGMSLVQSLNIKISTKDMSPSQIVNLSNDVRATVAKSSGLAKNAIQVQISADHYRVENSLARFINQSSIIKQSLPVDASREDKVNLLNQAMEQVIINSNLSFKDESGIPVVQILMDAFKDTSQASDAEKRLKQMCVTQLRQILAGHDMSNLVRLISTEVTRIRSLGKHIRHHHPELASSIGDSLNRFQRAVSDNLKFMDALGRFAPNEVYGNAYFNAMQDMKKEVRELQAAFPAGQVAPKAVSGLSM
ncbi:DNA primase [Neptuniibacter halophilus]|uniref:DNA primase n=1 Tax=Neptuniibacter halophilus TaxID=651666 RepID=UPI002573EBA1|nr:DNA primase [Neptuniibacter halophilus]